TTITQGSAQALTIANNGTANTVVNLQSTGDFVVQDNGTAALTVNDGGGVGIGNSGPVASALLEMSSTSKGMLVPRMTAAQRGGIGSPATGLLVYQTDGTTGFYVYNGTAWTALLGPKTGWATTGNAGTVAGTSFLGNTDDVALEFRVNNNRAGYVGNSSNYNSFFGFQAGDATTSADGNTGMGRGALGAADTGGGNAAFGQGALLALTSGTFNTAVGISAMQTLQSGTQNVAIGGTAGNGVTTGGFNTFVGAAATGSTTGRSSAGAFGNNAVADADSRIRIGGAGVNSIGGPVGFTNFSDQRFKFNIKANVQGLAFIKRLKPTTYQFNYDELQNFYHRSNPAIPVLEHNKGTDMIQAGFMAQEVEALCKEMQFEFGAVDKPDDLSSGIYGLRYATFVVPLVKAVQEQQELIEAQDKTIAEQTARLARLEQEFREMKTLLADKKGKGQ
ncbi:MAG: tail fiber domain-containing protein, partial [Bacteroidota bacterium]|nr:tail fiber domain-containing protein [Bacteroidota bacterium]